MATWYVRPDTSHNVTRDGTTYAKAWGGWSEIVWGVSGVSAGDTLYLCGAHYYGAVISVGAHLATVSSRATIRGDYAAYPGSITFSAGTYNLTCARNYTTIRNLRINAGDYGCIVLGNVNLTGVELRGNYFNASGNATGGLVRLQSFDTWNYTDIIIDNNDFVGGAGSVGGGAVTWWATSASATTFLNRVQITNNRMTGVSATRATVLLKISNGIPAGTKMTDITVSGNTFLECSSVGMEIYGPDTFGYNAGVKIFSNIISNQKEKATFGGGVVLGGFAPSATAGFGNNDIYSNQLYNVTGPSGFVNAFYGSYQIFWNYVDGLSTSTIDGNGILFDHGSDSCTAYGNEFRNIRGTGADNEYTAGFGILVLDATNCTAFGNIFDRCVNGAAFGAKSAAQSSNIFNNTFLNCTQSGVYIGPSADVTTNNVKNNIFTSTRSTNPAVNNSASTWGGEAYNCFYAFGAATGHTLNAATITTNPALKADRRPPLTSPVVATGTYLGGRTFDGKDFKSPPCIGGHEYHAPRAAVARTVVTRTAVTRSARARTAVAGN